MFSAGFFTLAADGSQGHESPKHPASLRELPLSRMAPSPPRDADAKDMVYFMIRNRQRERAYVIPKSVRNAATKRTRAAFGALSKAYDTLLTAEQQQTWNAAVK